MIDLLNISAQHERRAKKINVLLRWAASLFASFAMSSHLSAKYDTNKRRRQMWSNYYVTCAVHS